MSREKALSSDNDFLNLILDTYVAKNAGMKRFFKRDTPSMEDKHASIREIVKCFKGQESGTVPIMSVLKLQLERSKFLQISWLHPAEAENIDPGSYGYIMDKDGGYKINLQDIDDPYFSLPQSLLKV